MKILPYLLLTLLIVAPASPTAAADWVLIANPKAGIGHLSQDDVTNIYLGRYRRLASGLTAEPIDQPADSPLKARFYRQLVDKNPAEINAYWARLVFSGKTRPPRVAASEEEAVQLVSRNVDALAYVDKTRVDARVTVVFAIAE
jgi:hypothetical protein